MQSKHKTVIEYFFIKEEDKDKQILIDALIFLHVVIDILAQVPHSKEKKPKNFKELLIKYVYLRIVNKAIE